MFCDISKAFDRVWHKGLLLKLKCVGIRGSLLKWFSNYLLDRKQRVVIPGASSDWSSVTAGVPQGSILGPLLFLTFINDIDVDLDTNVRLFADDTSLYIIVDTPVIAASKLNTDLLKIHKWATRWLVTFNPSKSESLNENRKSSIHLLGKQTKLHFLGEYLWENNNNSTNTIMKDLNKNRNTVIPCIRFYILILTVKITVTKTPTSGSSVTLLSWPKL